MTLKEKAICEVYTGICFTAFDERRAVYEYASDLIGRPIYTHEFLILKDKLHELSKPDFLKVCAGEMEEVDDLC